MKRKERLDKLLVKRQQAVNIDEAKQLIEANVIRVNGIIRDNFSNQYYEDSVIELVATKRYVSRGGFKLESALNAFALNPKNYTCLDIGSSTGGFTDCLLQHGASLVYCVDVGYGILDWKLRSDKRVIVHERTNARYLTNKEITDAIDLCVIDASFISLNLLFKPLLQFFNSTIQIVALVKPQFQLAKNEVGMKGIVTDQALQQKSIDMVVEFAGSIGLKLNGTAASSIKGTKGNQEFFIYLTS